MRTRTLLLLLFVLSMSSSSFAQRNITEAEQFVARGELQMQYGTIEDALFYYKKATEISPNYALAQYYTGAVMAIIGRKQDDQQKLEEALPYLNKALKLAPRNYDIVNDWGVHFGELLKMKGEYKADNPDIQRIRKAYISVEKSSDQSGAYNLACHYSLLGDKEQAIQWLNITLSKQYREEMECISERRLKEETDFDNIRNTDEYKALVDKYFN